MSAGNCSWSVMIRAIMAVMAIMAVVDNIAFVFLLVMKGGSLQLSSLLDLIV